MQLTVERHYPIAVHRLYEIVTSKAFFEQRFAWGKIDNYRFDEFAVDPQRALIRIIQPIKIKTEKMPSFARRLVPASADLTTEFSWRDNVGSLPYIADYRFVLAGVPLNVEGVMTLTADGSDAASACRQITQVNISCPVPLVGRKIVSLLAPKVEEALAGDYRHTLRYVEEFG